MNYPLGVKYPPSFPGESRAKLDTKEIRNRREFDQASRRDRDLWSVRQHFRTFSLRMLLWFAQEAHGRDLWPSDELDDYCREYLRRITIRNAAAGMQDEVPSRYDGSITWQWQRFLEKSDLWRRYQDTLLKAARRQAAKAPPRRN